MADNGNPPAAAKPAGGKDAPPSRPLGPDGKPIPGPAEVRQIQAARKMAQQQAQVEEVTAIMHKNIENVLERDRKLGDLEERADNLQDGCAQFEKQAAAMKNKFWLENLKTMIAGGVVGLILLGLLYWRFMMPDNTQQPQQPYYGQYQPQGVGVPQPVATQAPAIPVKDETEAGGDTAEASETGGGTGGDESSDFH